jgi:hypothetical protein
VKDVDVARGLLLVLLAAAAFPFGSPAFAAGSERLVYQIVLTLPGSRSQGWHGVLYGPNGTPRVVPAGQRVETDIGTLISKPIQMGLAWRPYGMVPAAPGMRNDIAKGPWNYRLYETGIGTACKAWRGDLISGGKPVPHPKPGVSLRTPWGPFVWRPGRGWAHHAWKVRTVSCR